MGAAAAKRPSMTAAPQPTDPAADAAVIAATVLPATMSATPTQTQGDQQINQIAGTVSSTAGALTKPSTYAYFYFGSAVTVGRRRVLHDRMRPAAVLAVDGDVHKAEACVEAVGERTERQPEAGTAQTTLPHILTE